MRTRLIVIFLSVLTLFGVTAGASAMAESVRPDGRSPGVLPLPTRTPQGDLSRFAGVQAAGVYAIHSSYDNRCLDADLNTIGGNGTKVQMWECNYFAQQRWRFYTFAGGYLIENVYSGRVLDADLNTMCCNGTKVQLWDFLPDNANQRWTLWSDGRGNGFDNHYSGRSLDADLNTIGGNGTKVQLWDYVPGNYNQLWWLEEVA